MHGIQFSVVFRLCIHVIGVFFLGQMSCTVKLQMVFPIKKKFLLYHLFPPYNLMSDVYITRST